MEAAGTIADLDRQFGIPGIAGVVEGNGGLPKVRITSPQATAQMYLHGAKVTSGAARQAGRGQPSGLLLAAERRCRGRSVKQSSSTKARAVPWSAAAKLPPWSPDPTAGACAPALQGAAHIFKAVAHACPLTHEKLVAPASSRRRITAGKMPGLRIFRAVGRSADHEKRL